MIKRGIAFVDGENLTLRCQEMVNAGRAPVDGVVHERDSFVWASKITEWTAMDLIRVLYYTSVVGDDGRILEVTRKISSFGDLGHLDFIVALADETKRYLLMPYGSGPVALKSVDQHAGAVRLRFAEPAPDRVTIVFIEQ